MSDVNLSGNKQYDDVMPTALFPTYATQEKSFTYNLVVRLGLIQTIRT